MYNELIPLQCPSCAGHVDPVTLQCKSCGLAFKMRGDGTLCKIELSHARLISIGASVLIPSYVLRDSEHADTACQYMLEEMAHKMAKQILPLIEFQTEFNREYNDFVTYGRLRIAEPRNPLTVGNSDNPWRFI